MLTWLIFAFIALGRHLQIDAYGYSGEVLSNFVLLIIYLL
jgi:hypothetical protein